MYKIVFVRHGESQWNKENRFTGWTDVDLSEQGIAEAHFAAKLLKESGFTFDIAFTSLLKRSVRTLWIILDDLDLMWIPVYKSWRLNERHYGALQGLNKVEMTKKFGEELVLKWRRSYDVPPPPLERNDPRNPVFDPRYKDVPPEELPLCESLKDTVRRAVPLWENMIVPKIKAGRQILVSAHGNSLRAIVKYLDKITDDEIPALNIPTGIPFVYELDDTMAPIRHYYLADEETVRKAVDKVASQIKEDPKG